MSPISALDHDYPFSDYDEAEARRLAHPDNWLFWNRKAGKRRRGRIITAGVTTVAVLAGLATRQLVRARS